MESISEGTIYHFQDFGFVKFDYLAFFILFRLYYQGNGKNSRTFYNILYGNILTQNLM